MPVSTMGISSYFNPRPREGGDLPAQEHMIEDVFNPRPREGGDPPRVKAGIS